LILLLFIRTILEEMGRVKKGFQTYNDRLCMATKLFMFLFFLVITLAGRWVTSSHDEYC